MNKINQKGIAHLAIILVFAVLVIGGSGYLVWQRLSDSNITDNSENSNSTKDNVEDDSSTADLAYDTSKWVPYKPMTGTYEVSLPDGWILESPEDKDDLIAWNASEIVYTAGKVGQVVAKENSKMMSGSSSAFYLIYNYEKNNKSFLSEKLMKEKNYKSAKGVDVTKYKRTQINEDDTNGGLDIPVGTVQYTYDLVSGTKNIHIVHDVLKGETDQSKVIEAMIETVKFL